MNGKKGEFKEELEERVDYGGVGLKGGWKIGPIGENFVWEKQR